MLNSLVMFRGDCLMKAKTDLRTDDATLSTSVNRVQCKVFRCNFLRTIPNFFNRVVKNLPLVSSL